jgi:hypothetical protein
MIAYKTFADCPEENRPIGVLLDFPWMQQPCTKEDETKLKEQGFTIVEDDAYESLVTLLSDANQNSMRIAGIMAGVLTPAIAKGQELILTFAAENISLGITQANMTTQVRTVTSDVVSALSTGSLYDAILATKAIPIESYDKTFVTAERLLSFVNKIEEYLNIPISSELHK